MVFFNMSREAFNKCLLDSMRKKLKRKMTLALLLLPPGSVLARSCQNITNPDVLSEQTLPSLLKSAVASAGHTLIFVPSYFDFLRVKAHLKGIDDLEYACISE